MIQAAWRKCTWGAVLAATAACSGTGDVEGRSTAPRALSLVPIATLDDGSAPVLGEPSWVAGHPDGRFLVPDFSDRNVKIYDAAGKRAGTLGRAGQGPGEFSGPMYTGFYHDSIVEVDFVNGISLFSPQGRFARKLSLRGPRNRPVMDARVVDDSLLLLLTPAGGDRGTRLLSLVRSDGTEVSSFFDAYHLVGRDPEVVQSMGVQADGRGGVVFAALVGGDSLFAFDYSGARLAASLVDPAQPLVPVRKLIAANGGRRRKPDGSWVMHNNRNVLRIVALDSSTAVVFVAPYDTLNGTDPIQGGTVLVVTLEHGRIRHIGRREVAAGLIGRDSGGRALMLGYADSAAERYVLSHLRFDEATPQPGR